MRWLVRQCMKQAQDGEVWQKSLPTSPSTLGNTAGHPFISSASAVVDRQRLKQVPSLPSRAPPSRPPFLACS